MVLTSKFSRCCFSKRNPHGCGAEAPPMPSPKQLLRPKWMVRRPQVESEEERTQWNLWCLRCGKKALHLNPNFETWPTVWSKCFSLLKLFSSVTWFQGDAWSTLTPDFPATDPSSAETESEDEELQQMIEWNSTFLNQVFCSIEGNLGFHFMLGYTVSFFKFWGGAYPPRNGGTMAPGYAIPVSFEVWSLGATVLLTFCFGPLNYSYNSKMPRVLI